ncbi:histidine kinase [Flavobacterium sp.]|uniref:ATP-binding protein n=1 Tax=Flavobacterium sp. TaxID=239 RepID=UPI003B9BD6E0
MRRLYHYIAVLVIVTVIAASWVYFFTEDKDQALSIEDCQPRSYDNFLDGLIDCDPKDKIRALQLSKELKKLNYSDTCNLRRHKKISNYFRNQNDMRSFNIILNDVKDAVLRSKDETFLGKWYSDKCEYFLMIGRADIAYKYLEKAKQYRRFLVKTSYEYDILNQEISILEYFSQNVLAEKKTIDLLKKSINEGDPMVAQLSLRLANIYSSMSRYELSEEYYKNAIKAAGDRTDYSKDLLILTAKNNYAISHYAQGRFTEAYNLLKDVKKDYIDLSLADSEIQFKMILANYFLAKSHVSPNAKDLKSLDSICVISERIRDYHTLIRAKFVYAMYLHNIKGNTIKVKNLFCSTIELSGKYSSAGLELEYLQKFLKLFPNEDLKYYQRVLSLKDSIYLKQQNSFDKFARLEYEVDRYQKEAEEANLLSRRILIYSGLFTVFLIVLFFRNQILFFVKYRVLKLPLPKFDPRKNRPKGTHVHIGVHSGVTIERSRIARELHDNVLGKMTGLKLALLKFSPSVPEDKRAKYVKKVKSLDVLNSEIRRSTSDQFRELSEAYGEISKVLHRFIEEFSEDVDFNIKLHIDDEVNLDALNPLVKVHTYRIVQELLTNTLKYAESSCVRLSLEATEDQKFVFSYGDDGKGFDFPKIPKPNKGLSNVLVRGNEISATFEINTGMGKGFHLRMVVPDAFINQNQTTINHEHQDFIY